MINTLCDDKLDTENRRTFVRPSPAPEPEPQTEQKIYSFFEINFWVDYWFE